MENVTDEDMAQMEALKQFENIAISNGTWAMKDPNEEDAWMISETEEGANELTEYFRNQSLGH